MLPQKQFRAAYRDNCVQTLVDNSHTTEDSGIGCHRSFRYYYSAELVVPEAVQTTGATNRGLLDRTCLQAIDTISMIMCWHRIAYVI